MDYQAYNIKVLRTECREDDNGQYTLYVLRVDSSTSGTWVIERRYSEFDALHHKIQQQFPAIKADLPKLPPKKLIGKMSSEVIEDRKVTLANYLNLLLIHVKPTQSEYLKTFLEKNKIELIS